MTQPAATAAPVAPPRTRDPADARRWLKARREELRTRYLRRPDPQRSLAAHAALVDALLARLWAECMRDPQVALVAVGGYGTGRRDHVALPVARSSGFLNINTLPVTRVMPMSLSFHP